MSNESMTGQAPLELDDQLEKMNNDLLRMMEKSSQAVLSANITDLVSPKYPDSEIFEDDYLSIISDFNSLEQCSAAGNIEDQIEELLLKIDRQSMIIEDFKSNELRDLTLVLSRSEIATFIDKLETLRNTNPSTSLNIGSRTIRLEYYDEDSPYRLNRLGSPEDIPIYLLTPKTQKEKAKELPYSVAKLEKELSWPSIEANEIEIERKKNRLNNLKGEKAIYEAMKTSKSLLTSFENIDTVGMIRRRQNEIPWDYKHVDSYQVYNKNYLEQKQTLEDLKEEAKLISKQQNFQKIMLEKKRMILQDKEQYLAKRQQSILNNWLKEPTAKGFIPVLSATLQQLEEEQHLLWEKKEKFYNEITEFQNAKVKIESELRRYNNLIMRNQGKFKTMTREIENSELIK